ncbi:DUF6233 domain-containing protein [Streptomyces sp. NPDC088183]|uniref:DUF6233 domain-containing protein n=1 Tax=Streptomyces sp. NPDC088183 TaxID=3160992 RepID=UPI0034254885
MELGIGQGSPPTEVHAGHCHAAGKRRRVIDRDQARALLTDGIRACAHCRPDTSLGMLGPLSIERRRHLPQPLPKICARTRNSPTKPLAST